MAQNLNKQQRFDVELRAWSLRVCGFGQQRIVVELAKPVEAGGLGLTIDQSTVHRALARREQAIAKEFLTEAACIKARQTAQLEYLQEQAMGGWERSTQNAEKQRIKRQGVKGDTPGDAGEITPLSSLIPPTPEELLEGFDPEAVPHLYIGEDGEEVSAEERASKIAEAAVAFAQERLAQMPNAGRLLVVEQVSETKGQVGDVRFLAEARGVLADIRKIWGLDAPTKQEISGPDGGGIPVQLVSALDRIYGDAPDSGSGEAAAFDP